MKNKTLNTALGFIIKALLKLYKRGDQPMAVETNIGTVLHNFPKEGGMESWIPGHDFPFPGMPDSRVIETIDVIKKIFPIIYKWAWVVMRDRLPAYLIPQSQNGEIGLIDPKKYSRPIRELHRVFTLVRSREGESEMKAKWTEMRDIICLFLEYDDAYRWRFAEMILEINREEMKFSVADRYWADMKWKFNWGWKNNKEFWQEGDKKELKKP